MFDLLPMDVLDDIYKWIIGIEYHDKNKKILLQIKIQVSTVIHTLVFEYWTPYHNFWNLRLYGVTR